jgi:hypothetical protein
MKCGIGAPAAEDAPLDLRLWLPQASWKAPRLSASWKTGKHNLGFAQFRHALRGARTNPANGRAEGIQVDDIDASLQS